MKNDKILRDGFLKIIQREHEDKLFEVMHRGNAVNVLLVKPGKKKKDDTFYLGAQYRAGAGSVLVTNVAGMVDEGEGAHAAAIREALEEAGAVGDLYYMGSHYNSPGDSTTRTSFFVMLVSDFKEPTDKEEGVEFSAHSYWEVREIMKGAASMPLALSLSKYKAYRKTLKQSRVLK